MFKILKMQYMYTIQLVLYVKHNLVITKPPEKAGQIGIVHAIDDMYHVGERVIT